jgi:hypothetical protein
MLSPQKQVNIIPGKNKDKLRIFVVPLAFLKRKMAKCLCENFLTTQPATEN